MSFEVNNLSNQDLIEQNIDQAESRWRPGFPVVIAVGAAHAAAAPLITDHCYLTGSIRPHIHGSAGTRFVTLPLTEELVVGFGAHRTHSLY